MHIGCTLGWADHDPKERSAPPSHALRALRKPAGQAFTLMLRCGNCVFRRSGKNWPRSRTKRRVARAHEAARGPPTLCATNRESRFQQPCLHLQASGRIEAAQGLHSLEACCCASARRHRAPSPNSVHVRRSDPRNAADASASARPNNNHDDSSNTYIDNSSNNNSNFSCTRAASRWQRQSTKDAGSIACLDGLDEKREQGIRSCSPSERWDRRGVLVDSLMLAEAKRISRAFDATFGFRTIIAKYTLCGTRWVPGRGRLVEDQIEKMGEDAGKFAGEDKKVNECMDPNASIDGYMRSMRSAAEGSGDNTWLREKLDREEKERITDALKGGHSWLDSSPEAEAGEMGEQEKEAQEHLRAGRF